MPNEPVLFFTKKDGKQHIISIPDGRKRLAAYHTDITEEQYAQTGMTMISILFLIAHGTCTVSEGARKVIYTWHFNIKCRK